MSAISEFDQDTINYLKAAGIGKSHLDRVHMLAVRAAKLEGEKKYPPVVPETSPLRSLCVVGDDKGERICENHDYRWEPGERFCNHVINEEWAEPLIAYIDALEAQRATGVGTFEDGVQLMGSLMAQSSSDLAFTTNAIIANHEKTIEELRSLVYDFMKIIDEAEVIDRKTEARLDGPMTRAQIQWEMQARRGAWT